MRKLIWLLVLLSFPAYPAHADLVVVVSARSNVASLTREEVVNIFMGRYRKFPDGNDAHPLDMSADSPERRAFYRNLLGKSLAEINAYWARLVFSGRTSPPDEVRDGAILLQRLESDPAAIGYTERSKVDRDMRVLLALPD